MSYAKNLRPILFAIVVWAVIVLFLQLLLIGLDKEAARAQAAHLSMCASYGAEMNEWAHERGVAYPCEATNADH